VLANPILLDQQRAGAKVCPPQGADTETILRQLGFDDAAIALFKKESTI
jgi:crotonobetainyl-CoA:carnitine CoA-transferase CaiB-like acyl-CoA transferase